MISSIKEKTENLFLKTLMKQNKLINAVYTQKTRPSRHVDAHVVLSRWCLHEADILECMHLLSRCYIALQVNVARIIS